MSRSHAPERPRKYKEEPAPGAAHKMHHPHSAQGLPPPSHQGHHPQQHHPRSAVVQHHHQQHHQHQQHPDSPHQSQPAQSPAQAHYPSPHPSNPQVPQQHQQHQSPYVQTIQGPPGGPQQQEVPYYPAHPSPYSTNSAPSNYSSAETPELMAAATMNRTGFPPIPYHTPQSNSPASVQSPQHDQHGRPIYGQPPSQMQQYIGYTPYASAGVPQQSPYPQHPSSQQQPPMATNPLLMSHQQQGQPMQHPHQPHPHTPAMTGSPKSRMPQTPLQRPPSGLGGPPQAPPQGAPVGTPNMQAGPPGAMGANANAAPGPIPATTPLVVRQDQNGVQWIAFEYSRDRVKMEYTIRCDVESVNVDELPHDFKTENCVYPRACCAKDQYKGNRLHYETECNTVGWALAQLNPCLRGKRGLIQRAVDSWRNSNSDPRLRSRRVRRMAKMTTRKNVQGTNHMAGPGGPGVPGTPNSAGMAAPPRQPNMGMGGPQMHHHHEHAGGPQGGNDDVSANEYPAAHTHHHQAPNGQQSPNDVRQAQSFYPQFPTSDSVAGSSGMPPMHDGMGHHPPPPHAASVPVAKNEQDEEERKLAMFGDLPESKKRKFILVDDSQRGTRVRVRVTLDTVKMEEMPDSYRKSNSVFPRSYFAMQMTSPPASPRGSRVFSDESGPDNDPECPLSGSSLVPVPTLEGEVRVPKPRLTRVKRSKEITLNDLGYRMSWSQSRVFAGRTLFLQKSLDAYRNKMRSSMLGAGQDVTSVAPHFETRVGKRRWTERTEKSKKLAREGSP
ncbi:hypothetical protein P154DRAFT_519566 [Amniculicola lignicola CBS 123094]|uniref:DUF8032 domain-containing protein n=1 Tax=Amniculicola lignicola CBS 123094 TaxID=1392246 RepID=A0A6A5WQI4_9PLEO|nr:hypothetical protein P154DRAFT_519566 [Amniculicola lignicola CBS 123094]